MMNKLKWWIPIWGYYLKLKNNKEPYDDDRMVYFWEIYQTLITVLIIALGFITFFLSII